MSRVQKLFGLGMRSSMWLPRGNTRPGVTTPAVSFKYLKVRMELHEPRRRIGNVLVDLGVPCESHARDDITGSNLQVLRDGTDGMSMSQV